MTRRTHLLVVMALLLAVAGFFAPGSSSATFSARSTNLASTVRAAADWTPPTVSLANPGSPVKDTVTLTATAADGETGIRSVVISSLAPGSSTWVDLCTATSAPWSCGWNTKAVADGTYGLRARATDGAGHTTTSEPVTTTVANSLLVSLGDPGDAVRGTVTLPTTLYNTGSVTYTVRVEYALAGTGTWKTLCTGLTSPYTCSWNTTTFANDYYDLRSAAVAGSTTSYSAVVADVLVDNQAPTVTMVDPGTPLSGTRTFEATAADAHSGIAQVLVQYAASGSTSYKTLCTVATAPYSCRVDTTTILDGTYTFRAIATDVVGNTTTSALVTNRVVDNTVSSVSMEDPGAYLTGTVALTATANSTAGIASVRIQRAPNGTTSWTDVCSDAAAPYSCAWDTTTVPDGLYDLRAVLVDGTGKVTTSSVVGSRRVDNRPLRGFDIQTANGGASTGKIDNGDSITFTYNDEVNPATVAAGWNGGATAVTVRVRDGGLLGLGNKGDTLEVQRAGAAVNLGSVNLKEDYLKSGKTAVFNATMTAGTTTVGGVTATVVTVRLGTLASGGALRTVSNPSAMVWAPSAAVRDLFGNACSAAPVTETGALDREF